jgi:hypothetical protein
MKISELIEQLDAIKSMYGDIKIAVSLGQEFGMLRSVNVAELNKSGTAEKVVDLSNLE